MSLTEANALPVGTYAGLFAEFNYRNDPDRDKTLPDPPEEDFVLQQIEMMRAMGMG